MTRIVVNLHYKAQMLRDHLSRRRDAEILFSDETQQLLDTGGGVVKALPLLGGAPFFVINSDSIWVEGGHAALPAMMAAWDENRMDGLLLLADMETALGYESTGDFSMGTDGHVDRARNSEPPHYAYPGVQIVHPRLFADAARAGAFSTNADVEPRHCCQGTAVRHPCWTGCGSMSARPRRAPMTPKPISPSWRRRETTPHLFSIRSSAHFARELWPGG